jgi:tRNA A37 threonylcarbamoyladenosine modification protein TsaB
LPNRAANAGLQTTGLLAVAADALRGDVVAQSFAGAPGGVVESLGPQELIPAEAWLQRLAPGMLVAGPALVKLAGRLPAGVEAMDRQYWFPRAAWVGRLAVRDYALGRRDDLWRLAPRYFRRAAAEEKWEAMGR